MARSLGRYELLQPLARGGMADVYLARRRGPAGVEKRLVVKRIRPERAADPRTLALFVKEARLSVDLAHANIVPVFDFGRVGNELFLAMEYVEGRDLAAALKRASERAAPLDPVLVAFIGAEACQALDYAHRRTDGAGRPLGIVHRDVTPRNVLLSFSGEVKLTDFGVASLGADEETGRLRGTPAYMSPEQARGEAVDGRSDLFSLGLVLAEAATGERLYRGGDTDALLACARAGRLAPLPDSMPAPLRAAIERATRTDRDERFPDARAMQQACDAIVVAARAADPSRPAPGHELAAWLGALFPEGPAGEEERDAPIGVVTFGEEGLDDRGAQTMRSIAETLAEEPGRRPRRALALIAGLVAAAAIGLAFWAGPRIWSPAATPDAAAIAPPPPLPARAIDAPIAIAVVVLDAPVRAPSPPPPPPPPRRAVTPPRLYPVDINSRPWARVAIDGRYVDDTPFRAQLGAGTHRLRFDNPADGSTKTIVIEVPRDRPVLETLEAP